jgi:hypothetical protein
MEENRGGVAENVGEVLRVSVWWYILRRKVGTGFGNLWKVRRTRKTEFSMDFGRIVEGIWKESGISTKMNEKVLPSNPNLMMVIDGFDGTSRDMANVNNRGNR